ncbi:hypothetical protein P872_21800 [Rhodonellum psychrophilum GCM71 = DSM 17998]|uniref:DUF3278 domain-containing protein n=2 Tax=Rhodonellum TaxID=336827 RepID=U5BX09_9BACT|nr:MULTISPECIES: hypothetical protein [Rhodonellum]ERM80447.1 hypothetical protein P872_21800 [Rhodonellum psychrophilum GCM71 = DSM 17998]SDZ08322.1 hypothetical protein SAMN05444412_105222 [Rhodonellum ikkaensis]
MELEEMKATWEALSQKVAQQEKLTHKMIENMTHQKYKSRLNKILYPEILGSIICFLGAIFMILNFQAIEGPIMQVFGILSILLLFGLPIISLASLSGLRKVNVSLMTYAEAIRNYSLQKIRFQKLQKLNVSMALLFLLIATPVFMEMNGKDISNIPYFWKLIFPLGVILFLGFSVWVLKNYNSALKKAEDTLSEIQK